MSKEAMKLALEAFEYIEHNYMSLPAPATKAITALREALAEQPAQQEPVAWPCLIAEADFSENTVTLEMQCTDYKVSAGKHWLSKSPPAQRKPLTDEQMWSLWNSQGDDAMEQTAAITFARAIEAAHGIKENT
jgi:hypothetical protein